MLREAFCASRRDCTGVTCSEGFVCPEVESAPRTYGDESGVEDPEALQEVPGWVHLRVGGGVGGWRCERMATALSVSDSGRLSNIYIPRHARARARAITLYSIPADRTRTFRP